MKKASAQASPRPMQATSPGWGQSSRGCEAHLGRFKSMSGAEKCGCLYGAGTQETQAFIIVNKQGFSFLHSTCICTVPSYTQIHRFIATSAGGRRDLE